MIRAPVCPVCVPYVRPGSPRCLFTGLRHTRQEPHTFYSVITQISTADRTHTRELDPTHSTKLSWLRHTTTPFLYMYFCRSHNSMRDFVGGLGRGTGKVRPGTPVSFYR